MQISFLFVALLAWTVQPFLKFAKGYLWPKQDKPSLEDLATLLTDHCKKNWFALVVYILLGLLVQSGGSSHRID
jgi:hypothetical protein